MLNCMDKLTPREQEVARALHRGDSRKNAARQLGMSVGTLRNHVTNIYAKLGIKSANELVLFVERAKTRG
jgi:DNA-binding NarL/FixJ family response regulator